MFPGEITVKSIAKYGWFLLVIICMHSLVWAGNTGKIAGEVIDKQTGDPLIGANVIVKGTDLGAATDENGEYYILQVPPGTYELECSYIGYHALTIKNVQVQVDITRTINFEMQSTAIESPTVEIVAERPMVQPDETSTRKTTTREDIAVTPGIEQTSDVFRMQGGVVFDNSAQPQQIQLGDGQQLQVRDESLKDVHVRGGRGGEILYMVDGVPVTHPIYGGRDVLNLNVVDVEEMELLTGAFNAEYGQAQSGVVNITTRSGGEKFRGGIEYKTDEPGIWGPTYNLQYTSFHLGGPEPITRNLLPNIGINIPGKMNFFISGNGKMTNQRNNNHRDRASLFSLPFIGTVNEKQANTGNLNAKLSWDVLDNLGATLSYKGSWNEHSNFQWLWKNIPNHTSDYSGGTKNINLRINHTLSKSTYYDVNFGYLGVQSLNSLNGRPPADDFWWDFGIIDPTSGDTTYYKYEQFKQHSDGMPDSLLIVESLREAPNRDPLTGFFDQESFQSPWIKENTSTYTVKADFTSQVHPDHLLKTGIQVQSHELHSTSIQGGGVQLSDYGEWKWRGIGQGVPTPSGPYKEFAQTRWIFDAKPIVGGSYLQDKFEKESLIINAGVRFDWFLPGSSIQGEQWKQRWEQVTGLEADWKTFKYSISPRFGVSFPISVNTGIFFSYGHFTQLPEMQFYYRDPFTGGIVGNPHLDYEQTISYEFGFNHQLARNWAIDIKSYTKDISKSVTQLSVQSEFGQEVTIWDNGGYSRVRGLEFNLNKRYSNFTRGRANYTLQWASGYSSSAFEDYVRSQNDFPKPIRERRKNYDIRHQITLNGTVSSPPGKHLTIFGLKLPDNWSATVLYSLASGRPYTPGTIDQAERQKLFNTEMGPLTTTTDLKLEKSFRVAGLNLALFMDIFNLWDAKNVNPNNDGFNNWTGEPYKYGDVTEPTNQYYNWYDMYRIMDPFQYSPGRHTQFGIRMKF